MIQAEIKSIPNHVINRTYTVSMVYPGFRCQQEVDPTLINIADLTVIYSPDERLYDFGSLSSYLRSFERESLSLETCANRVLDDMVGQLRPIGAKVLIHQQREHGIEIRIEAAHGRLRA